MGPRSILPTIPSRLPIDAPSRAPTAASVPKRYSTLAAAARSRPAAISSPVTRVGPSPTSTRPRPARTGPLAARSTVPSSMRSLTHRSPNFPKRRGAGGRAWGATLRSSWEMAASRPSVVYGMAWSVTRSTRRLEPAIDAKSGGAGGGSGMLTVAPASGSSGGAVPAGRPVGGGGSVTG